MAFTDVEMAILSKLAYYGSNPDKQTQPSKGRSLHSILTDKDINAYLKGELGDGYDDALEGLIRKTDGKDYKIVAAEDDKKDTGFAAIAIKDPDNNVTVAARGTEGINIFDSDASRRDVVADLELAYSLSTRQQEQMELFMQSLEEDDYDGYYFTGHSLGGNLANYGAFTFKPIDKVKGVVTFNAPGFNEAVMAKYATEIAEIYNRIMNYQNEYDYVSSIMYVPGPVTIVESAIIEDGKYDFDDHLGFADHYLSSMTVDGDGFDAREPQEKRIQTEFAHGVIEWLRDITGIKGYTILVGVVELGINLGRFTVSVVKKVASWIKNLFSGKNGSSYGSFLELDTAALRKFADRLKRVNTRIARLDEYIDSLHKRTRLPERMDLRQADLLAEGSRKLNKCIKYLNDTAQVFEDAERTIANKI